MRKPCQQTKLQNTTSFHFSDPFILLHTVMLGREGENQSFRF